MKPAIIVVLAALGLAACGIKGPLELPEGAAPTAAAMPVMQGVRAHHPDPNGLPPDSVGRIPPDIISSHAPLTR